MKINEAVETFGLNSVENESFESLHKLFRKLSFERHPDRGGDTIGMQVLNDAWDTFRENFTKHGNSWLNWDAAKSQADYSVADLFREILPKLQKFEGLEIEMIGSWLWIRGETKQWAEELGRNGVGCRWNRKENCWTWSPPTEKKRKYRKTMSMSYKREKYGSQTIYSTGQAKLG
jgi:hypothetical protein